jgi:hypothetical protein
MPKHAKSCQIMLMDGNYDELVREDRYHHGVATQSVPLSCARSSVTESMIVLGFPSTTVPETAAAPYCDWCHYRVIWPFPLPLADPGLGTTYGPSKALFHGVRSNNAKQCLYASYR